MQSWTAYLEAAQPRSARQVFQAWSMSWINPVLSLLWAPPQQVRQILLLR